MLQPMLGVCRVTACTLHVESNMELPLQITFRDIPHSDAIEAYIRQRASKLETLSARITSCHVAVESPHKHKHTARPFRVRVDLMVPGGEVVVSHAQDDHGDNTDAYAAIDYAFDRLDRRLEDHIRRMRSR
jgi:ribosomal subunit interface protein